MGAHLSISLWHRGGLGGSGTHGGGRTRRVSSVEPESVSSFRKNNGLVCGKRRRFVLIRTGRFSSGDPESVSRLYRKDLVLERGIKI